jgi:hypothetical protein
MSAKERREMSFRRFVPFGSAVFVLALAACGGGGGGGANHPLGAEAVVEHTELSRGKAKTTLGITVQRVRKGTQQELTDAGFSLDPSERSTTPYYVDARFTNKGSNAIKRNLSLSLEDQDGNLISSTVIIELGGTPFQKCRKNTKGALAPGESFETCTLFLVPKGREPSEVSFLPNDPGAETEFVYWDVA